MASRLESLSDRDCNAFQNCGDKNQSTINFLAVVELALGVDNQYIDETKCLRQ